MNDVWYAWRGVEEGRKRCVTSKKGRKCGVHLRLFLLGSLLRGLRNYTKLSQLQSQSVHQPHSPLPPPFSVFSTDLMTPTATVCLMSRTAKRPRGGYSEYDSTHIGLLGTSLTMQASPDLTNFGDCSMALPVRRSIFSRSSENLQAMCAVWQSRTGA